MKGTIDASLPDARERILNDPKEFSEHATIVDLIRNDLSQVATAVRVNRFRYIEEITAHRTSLLQVSSEISGKLPIDYHQQIGDIMYALLPAGSISGAPKNKTVEIIKQVEGNNRNYFTGVFGCFDGHQLDSGVMIRFIEKQDEQLVFKSGGGITAQSDLILEYQEMIDKVYVPINRIH
jgi:para-aminobenzoate synthetase component 1